MCSLVLKYSFNFSENNLDLKREFFPFLLVSVSASVLVVRSKTINRFVDFKQKYRQSKIPFC